MISLDWKERLKKDTIDFYERKLPQKDYDIDIVYNAYPERIDNNIPQAVITFVGKHLASKLAKDADVYYDFYDYLLRKKGENGTIIFAYIMSRAVRKKPDVYLKYLRKILASAKDQKSCNLIIDKAIYPVLKKNPQKYIDLVIKWIDSENKYFINGIDKLLIKLIHNEPELAKHVFEKLETSWLYATSPIIKLNTSVLKEIYKTDPEFYFTIYENYKTTRNPVFAEILGGAICCSHETIDKIVQNWSRSGNIKLKKIGLHCRKLLQRKGKK